LLTEYDPGMLAERSITPEAGSITRSLPDENTPALEPAVKIGFGSDPLVQYSEDE
jgi:hypothetical protein